MRIALLAALSVLAAPMAALAAEPPCKLTEADWTALAHARGFECDGCVLTPERVATLDADHLADLCKTRVWFDDMAAQDADQFTETHTAKQAPPDSRRLYSTEAEQKAYMRLAPLLMEKAVARGAWKDRVFEDQGFQASFPDFLEPNSFAMDSDGVRLSMTVYSTFEVSLMVVTTDLSRYKDAPIDRIEKQAIAAFGSKGFVPEAPEGKATLGGLPAREVFWKDPALGHVRARFVVRGSKLYMVAVFDRGQLGRFPQTATTGFLDSFRFLGDPV
jgi:hypothetical protein